MKKYFTTKEKASMHDTTMPLLQSMYAEIKELSKKKPDALVSKSKIKVANRLLEKVRAVLIDEASLEFLDLLDEDDMPQVSDVSIMLSQYLAAMKEFKYLHYGEYQGEYNVWVIEK